MLHFKSITIIYLYTIRLHFFRHFFYFDLFSISTFLYFDLFSISTFELFDILFSVFLTIRHFCCSTFLFSTFLTSFFSTFLLSTYLLFDQIQVNHVQTFFFEFFLYIYCSMVDITKTDELILSRIDVTV